MNKVELHIKTKYSLDKTSTIDIEAILWNAKENGEKGIVFVDKDSIMAFPKIEKIYNKLCEQEKSFKKFKIGYGVQLTAIIEEEEYEVIILIKNRNGLRDIYEIISLYLNEYERKIPINELVNRDHFLLGLMLDEKSQKLDLSIFDYLEIHSNIDVSKIKDKNKIVYSNVPNALFDGELEAKKVLYFHKHIDASPECRLYLNTEETLKKLNNEEIVITNSNRIFDELDKIIINDELFHTTHIDNFDEFENLVRINFQKKFKNPSTNIVKRLKEELKLIKELDYTYYYELLMIIVNHCKENKEYYQLDGTINNSLVAYILDLTEIEPFKLPYELFFSEIPRIEMILSPKFYHEKMLPFLTCKLKDKLVRCNYKYKLSKTNIPRIIKHYEIKKKVEIKSWEKDYIMSVLKDIPLYQEYLNNAFYLIPKEMDILNFTPYELKTGFSENDSTRLKGTYYDYHNLENNLIKLQFILNDEIENITNLINHTKSKIKYCNDKRVFNLFRNTEEFNCKFQILDKSTGTLNISFFDVDKLETKLMNIPNIWLDDLINILMKINHGIIKDDLYVELKKRNLDDKNLFQIINYLKEMGILLVSKASLLNKIRISYSQMYYKLYFPKEYYKELLANIADSSLKSKVFKYDIETMKQRYFKLNERNKLDLSTVEYEEYELLKILIEIVERKIKLK